MSAFFQRQISAIHEKLREQEQVNMQQQTDREQEAKLRQEVCPKHLLSKL